MTFEEHLQKYLPKDEINKLMDSFSENDKKAIYLNKNKMDVDELTTIFPNIKKHPLVENGFIFNKDEYQLGKKFYHDAGCYYIQEPSAMLVANFLDAKPGDVVLDLCAAPGGKTIQTALKMENTGMIIANDLSKERANVLLSNIERLGISNTVVTSLDFSKQYNKFFNYFDKIILDAPCSGSGMFRKSEEMRKDWTYEKVKKCSETQKQLITMCYSMLKEGGTLIYSTCSYSYEEDEEVVEYLLNSTNAKLINIPHFDGEYRRQKFSKTVHLFPSHFEGEGHYIALFQKPGILKENNFEEIVYKRQSLTEGGIKQIDFFKYNHKLPKGFEDLCLRPGLFLYSKINEKIIPSHHSSHATDNFKTLLINENDMIKYVSGQSLQTDVPDGYYYVGTKIKNKTVNIGVAHCINKTLKNLYPKGLRVNSSIASYF